MPSQLLENIEKITCTPGVGSGHGAECSFIDKGTTARLDDIIELVVVGGTISKIDQGEVEYKVSGKEKFQCMVSEDPYTTIAGGIVGGKRYLQTVVRCKAGD